VNDEAKQGGRRRQTPAATKSIDRTAEGRGTRRPEGALREADDGLSANLQAHIGRHVRAMFDEVAREPIPERLLRLLNDLEQSGDK
jgi:hypothetical protein